MKLTNRLQVVADMVDDAHTIYDVGCDHAYLDIYLASQGFNCVAIDVRKPVIEFAQKNVSDNGFENKVKVILNNGLDNIKVEKNDIVILSGLGAKTILDITKNQPIRRLIIQSNDNLFLLRKTMIDRNYYISEEKIVFEDNKYYVIIQFELGSKKYSNYELLLGPKLLQNKDTIFIQYLSKMYEHFQKVFNEIPNSYSDRKNEIQEIIDYIKMALK